MQFLWLLSRMRTPLLDAIFSGITELGAALLLVPIACLLYWIGNRRLSNRILFVFFTSALAVQVLKLICRIPRPWVLDPAFAPVASALSGATGYSFPSGHSQSAMALYGSLALFFTGLFEHELRAGRRVSLWYEDGSPARAGEGRGRTAAALLCLLLALLVGLSRMYLGVHTPADVLCAFAITGLIAVAVFVMYPHMIRADGAMRMMICSAGGLLSLCAIVFALQTRAAGLAAGDAVAAGMAADCYKAGAAAAGYFLAEAMIGRRVILERPAASAASKLLQVVIGLIGLLLLEVGIKKLFGSNPALDMLRYFSVSLWAVLLWPALQCRGTADAR